MKKITKIVAAALALALTFGAAGCSKSTDYPDFINPTGEQVDETSEKYVINVLSEGGLKLNGVQVAACLNGSVIKRGISVDGKIEFGISLGEYDLVVDESSLPAGYYLNETQYTTNPDKRDEVTIRIPSKVITQSATSGTTYSLGQIVRDFSFTDCTGKTYTVADTLSTKKALVLNFFYTTCGPCKSEFPAINTAYAKNSDVEIFAICYTGRGDTNATVQEFKQDLGLSFPMGMDDKNLCNNFSADAFPTTVVIDRYGLIAYRSTGSESNASFWTSLFGNFTSDSYVQKLSTSDGEESGSSDGTLEKPDVYMPESSVMQSAACMDGLKATFSADEDEYSWPWLANTDVDDKYIYTSNAGKGSSYSIVYIDVEMKEGDVLAFDYNVSSEADADYLYAFIDDEVMNGDGWSGNTGWQSVCLYVADRDRTVSLAFAYRKDSADPEDAEGSVEDVAKIRNIHLTTESAIEQTTDVMRACASGLEEDSGKYDYYVNAVYNESDGFYHKDTKDGALIMITLLGLTPWSRMHTNSLTTDETSGDSYYSTLYELTYYKYATGTESSFSVKIGDLDITDRLKAYRNISNYMDAPNYLLPVNKELKEWAQAFVDDWEKENGNVAYDNEWLEFCYYYDHYGPAHQGDDECPATKNVTLGLTTDNCYVAYEKTDAALESSATKGTLAGANKAIIAYAMDTNRGTYYKFTAKSAGVYQIRAYTKGDGVSSSSTIDPSILIYDENGDMIVEGSSDVLDADQYSETYEGFNVYIALEANQTVYLRLRVAMADTGSYDFIIEYKGESLDKMMICSTGGGAWTYDPDDEEMNLIYLGVKVAKGTDGNGKEYWYKADEDGNPIYSQPVYLDMLNPSFYMGNKTQIGSSDSLNYSSLRYIIEGQYFSTLKQGSYLQNKMSNKLQEALARDEDDPLYGYVQADPETTEIINKFLDDASDGRGDGYGWEAFATYIEHFGL